ncbi:MAG TPA: OsmC family protein [Anaerolineales bacterium]|nr:OsmC family protein [Anaerolineales bacterium]
MSIQTHIRDSMQGVIEYYTQNPDQALSQDKEAIAVIEEGLRARATGPDGQTLICDMPKGLGGGATAPSPGWTMRAALANCEAIMIALRAAQLGVELTTLEVRVDSLSDDRGMLGMDDSKPAGPLNMKISLRIGAQGVALEKIHEIIAWAEKHSPVGEPLTRIMPTEYLLEIV